MMIWMSFLVMMTYVFIRDGGFHQFEPQIEMAIIFGFWVFGLGGSGYFFSQPAVTLQITPNQIIATEIWLTKKETHPLKKEDVKDIYIRAHRDSDGDSYELILQTQTKDFAIKQSPALEEIEALKAKLQSLI